MLEYDSVLVICHTFFLYSSIDGHRGYKLANGNIDTISEDIHVSLCYINHLLRKDGAMDFNGEIIENFLEHIRRICLYICLICSSGWPTSMHT